MNQPTAEQLWERMQEAMRAKERADALRPVIEHYEGLARELRAELADAQ